MTDGSATATMLARIVLASGSPRRRELLARLGVKFDVCPTEAAETALPGESPWQTARRLARLKLEESALHSEGRLVLAADTVVELDVVALGKPGSAAEATRMLERLRGRPHLVHTAVALRCPGLQASVINTTRVLMRPYTDEEIALYVATGDPMDKAGAYAIQDAGFRPVHRIEGLLSTVVGLPLAPTARLLTLAGVGVRDDAAEEDLLFCPAVNGPSPRCGDDRRL